MASILALDVGKSSIKMAEGSYSKKGLNIVKTAIVPSPEGIVERGYIADEETVRDSIRAAMDRYFFKAREVTLTFNAPGAVIREVSLPRSKPKELDLMIKNEMLHTYHLSEDNIFQYKLINTVTDEKDGQLKDVYQVAALDNKLAEGYYNVLKSLKFKKPHMDININTADKLFSLVTEVNNESITDKACLFIDLGSDYTTAYVRSDGRQELFRQLDIGSREIEDTLSEETLIPQEEIRKKKEGDMNLFTVDDQAVHYYEILKPYFYNLLEELRKIIRFYYNRSEGTRGIDCIYLYGGGSDLAGLANYFSENLSIKTEVVKTLNKIYGNLPTTNFSSFLNAFGALIRY